MALAGAHKPIAGLSGIHPYAIEWNKKRNPSASLRNIQDIFPAWVVEQMEADSARVAAGQVPLKDVYGEKASKILGITDQSSEGAIDLGSQVKKNDFVPKLIYGRNPLANPDAIVGGAEHMVQAVHPQTGEVIGKMTWWEKTVANAGEIDKIDVAENYRRMGIGTSMLNKAKELSQVDENIPFPIHSATRTEMGEAWARSTGDILPPRVGEEAAVAARVSSRAVAETVEEGVEKVVRHSGATGRLLGAATEASAAVAGGINSSGALRNIGTALTVLRGRL